MVRGRLTQHRVVQYGVYTIRQCDRRRRRSSFRRVIQLIDDVTDKSSQGALRVLDLACLEGLYAIELARQGASVVAIEGRGKNIAKSQFAKEVLSLDGLQLIQDDVRNLSSKDKSMERFDVVLCAGRILYHLDAPDVFDFLARVAECVCRGFVVIDTHVSLEPAVRREFNGKAYWGKTYTEHAIDTLPAERAAATWSSLDNVTSFWLTRPSLYNALSHASFTSVSASATSRPEPAQADGLSHPAGNEGNPATIVDIPSDDRPTARRSAGTPTELVTRIAQCGYQE